MLLVGSKALSINLDVPIDYRDIDLIGTNSNVDDLIKELNPTKVVRNSYIATLYDVNMNDEYDRPNIEILISDDSESLKKYVEKSNGIVASNEILFSLKKSHIHFPIKFEKHIITYNILYVLLNGKDELSDITSINFKETENRLGKLKTPSLNKKVSGFFEQSNGYVKSYFVHDEIHQMVAHLDRPLYEYMQEDEKYAMCSKKLWSEFSHENKCKCILEEVYVIALERKILPMLFGGGDYWDSDKAFKWALMRVCTTLCSGWFREFATDNYFSIINMHESKFVNNFLDKYDQGLIKRLK